MQHFVELNYISDISDTVEWPFLRKSCLLRSQVRIIITGSKQTHIVHLQSRVCVNWCVSHSQQQTCRYIHHYRQARQGMSVMSDM